MPNLLRAMTGCPGCARLFAYGPNINAGMRPLHLHIFGASGSGTTTLGRELATALDLFLVDTDDIFWVPTDPPFQRPRAREDRIAMLSAALDGKQRYVVSGSLCGWGDLIMPHLTLAVFLSTPTPLRIQRLSARELARFGHRILPGGEMHDEHQKFITWAATYDSGPITERSRLLHETWLAQLPCLLLRLDGSQALHHLRSQVSTALLGQSLHELPG